MDISRTENSSKTGSKPPLRPLVFEILLLLNQEKRHGYGLMMELSQGSGGRRLGPGTLYRTLKELLELGWIEPDEAPGDGDERRRYYCLTPLGRRVAAHEAWRMQSLLRTARSGRLLPDSEPSE